VRYSPPIRNAPDRVTWPFSLVSPIASIPEPRPSGRVPRTGSRRRPVGPDRRGEARLASENMVPPASVEGPAWGPGAVRGAPTPPAVGAGQPGREGNDVGLRAGRGSSLLTHGDIEENPGPGADPRFDYHRRRLYSNGSPPPSLWSSVGGPGCPGDRCPSPFWCAMVRPLLSTITLHHRLVSEEHRWRCYLVRDALLHRRALVTRYAALALLTPVARMGQGPASGDGYAGRAVSGRTPRRRVVGPPARAWDSVSASDLVLPYPRLRRYVGALVSIFTYLRTGRGALAVRGLGESPNRAHALRYLSCVLRAIMRPTEPWPHPSEAPGYIFQPLEVAELAGDLHLLYADVMCGSHLPPNWAWAPTDVVGFPAGLYVGPVIGAGFLADGHLAVRLSQECWCVHSLTFAEVGAIGRDVTKFVLPDGCAGLVATALAICRALTSLSFLPGVAGTVAAGCPSDSWDVQWYVLELVRLTDRPPGDVLSAKRLVVMSPPPFFAQNCFPPLLAFEEAMALRGGCLGIDEGHPRTGRGDAPLSHGDVAPNPGPPGWCPIACLLAWEEDCRRSLGADEAFAFCRLLSWWRGSPANAPFGVALLEGSRVYSVGRGSGLLTHGDIASNPGPPRFPLPGPCCPSWGVFFALARDPDTDCYDTVMSFTDWEPEPPVLVGPSGPGGQRHSSTMMSAECVECGAIVCGPGPGAFALHSDGHVQRRIALDMAAWLERRHGGPEVTAPLLSTPECVSGTSGTTRYGSPSSSAEVAVGRLAVVPRTGRGDALLTCGDVEENPGPDHPPSLGTPRCDPWASPEVGTGGVSGRPAPDPRMLSALESALAGFGDDLGLSPGSPPPHYAAVVPACLRPTPPMVLPCAAPGEEPFDPIDVDEDPPTPGVVRQALAAAGCPEELLEAMAVAVPAPSLPASVPSPPLNCPLVAGLLPLTPDRALVRSVDAPRRAEIFPTLLTRPVLAGEDVLLPSGRVVSRIPRPIFADCAPTESCFAQRLDSAPAARLSTPKRPRSAGDAGPDFAGPRVASASEAAGGFVDQAGNLIRAAPGSLSPGRPMSPEPSPRGVRGSVMALRECAIPGCSAGPFSSSATYVTHLNAGHRDHTVEVPLDTLRAIGAWFCACGKINLAGRRCSASACRGTQPKDTAGLVPGPMAPSEAPLTPRARTARDTRVCPIPCCSHHTVALTRASLLGHVARLHVAAGQAIDDATLAWLGHSVCTSCRCLYRTGVSCPFCLHAEAPQGQGPMDVDLDLPAFPALTPPPLAEAPPGHPIDGPMPVFAPSLVEVLERPVNTLRHVPAACRVRFAAALGSTLSRLVSSPTWEDLYRLLSIAKMTLVSPPRGGAGHPGAAAAEVGRRLVAFERSQYQSLWPEAEPLRRKPVTRRDTATNEEGSLPKGTARVVESLVAEGALAKAAKALVSRGLADLDDPGNREALLRLNPVGEPVTPVEVPAPDFGLTGAQWKDLVHAAIVSFPAGSAPGPSGLRPCHLKDCIRRPGSAGSLLPPLTAFVRRAAAGLLPAPMAPWLCAAKTIPLRKKDGGIRPIAVGDTLRRTIGKVLLRTSRSKAEVGVLAPRQCGVGVPGAAEHVGMAMQAFARAHPEGDWVALQVDVRNAFNCIQRPVMLEQCARKCPAAFPWLQWCYSQPCRLLCQGSTLVWSTRGVHQGDTMGPLGFALGLDAALDVARAATGPLVWSTWYLDDGILVGSVSQVIAAWEALSPALRACGLEVNPGKCALWGPATARPGAPCSLPDVVAMDHSLRDVPVVHYGAGAGITVLGTPVDAPGWADHTQEKWHRAVDGTIEVLRAMRGLPDGQIRHCILRHCLDACKVNHLMRSTAMADGELAASRLTAALKEAVTDLIGRSLTPVAWAQATLPTHLQGLGIRDPATCWGPARVAAIAGFCGRASHTVGAPPESVTTPPPDTPAVLRGLATVLGAGHDPTVRWIADPVQICSAASPFTTQAWWAEQVTQGRRKALGGMGTARDRVRLSAQEGSMASEWLRVVPCLNTRTVIPDREFRSLCCWWLGVPVISVGDRPVRCPMPACREDLDAYGDHLVCCPYNGLTKRHNALRDAWCGVLRGAAIDHGREVVARGGSRPADILLVGWDGGSDVAVDLVVSHPLQAASWPLSADTAERHLREQEATKIRRNGGECAAAGWGCHPAAYTPWGGMGRGAASLLAEVSKRAGADGSGWAMRARAAETRQSLSLALMREVARQLDARCLAQEDVVSSQ
jgi:hypothetical protein